MTVGADPPVTFPAGVPSPEPEHALVASKATASVEAAMPRRIAVVSTRRWGVGGPGIGASYGLAPGH